MRIESAKERLHGFENERKVGTLLLIIIITYSLYMSICIEVIFGPAGKL